MSALKESTKKEENDNSVSEISDNVMSNQTFSPGETALDPMQCSRENVTPNSDQADLLTHVSFIDSICADGPAKAAYVNGSTSPNISDEILLDISKNVPGFLPKSLHAQNSTVTTNIQFEENDPLRKDREMTIRQMLTAEDVEHRGIWGFDAESPENSLDSYDDGSDLSWNPQREFMKFLLDDHDRSETEEKIPTVSPSISHRKRKRKMDMVVMVDPSEDLYTDLNLDSKNDHLGDGTQTDNGGVNKGDPQWKQPGAHSAKNLPYSNGTTVAFKHFFPKPAKNRKSQKLGFVKENLSTDSGSEEEPMFFPSNSKFKDKSHSRRHMKNRSNAPHQKPFICKECGRAFFDHNSLLKHITIHQSKRKKCVEEIKGTDKLTDEGKDARFQCPQCTFGTNCPNTFVQHAKTHEKDKRYYHCEKCNYVAMNETELKGHMLCEHCVSDAQYLIIGKQDGLEEENDASDINSATSCPALFSCKVCPFKTKNKNILRSHVERLHQQIFGGDSEDLHSLESNENRSPTKQSSSFCRLPSAGSQSTEKEPEHLLSVNSRKKESSVSDQTQRLLQMDKAKQKDTTNDKLRKNESRLDKSIKTLLSRKRHNEHNGSESKSNQKSDKVTIKAKCPDLGNDRGDDSLDPETTVSGKDRTASLSKTKRDLFSMKEESSLTALKSDGNGRSCEGLTSCNDDFAQIEKSSSNYERSPLGKSALKKSPSKRKMSTPFHNMQGQHILIDFPKCRQIFKKKDMIEMYKEVNNEDGFVHNSTHNSSSQLTTPEVNDGLYINSQFLSKRSAPTKGSPRASIGHLDQDPDSPQMFSIKEEYMETEVCGDTSESNSTVNHGAHADFEADLKSCPYCPALFESGVGLSNHIRGHLHRVGLSYNARHAVSVAQVACQDKVPPIRRRMVAVPQVKAEEDSPQPEQLLEPSSEEQAEQPAELTCPLCREWFDTRTGLSNHVRGHLKRLGKACSSSTTKSPVIILKELMRDKKQFQLKLQALEKKCRASNTLYPFRLSNGLIFSTAKVQRFGQGGKRQGHVSAQAEEEKTKTETKDGMKESPSSDLIGILKKRRAHEEVKVKSPPQTARKALLLSPVKERVSPLHFKTLPNSISEKSELNRKVCVHCNTTFHSGVSLSNHLRAYARRQRNALLEGTTYDCKQRKQRSRSGSKKKTFPMLHTPEEIYRLTCRFCDLVFQGPLSVQEDWVKHLQRHIMNTAVPRTGAGMVEVSCFPEEPSSDTEPQTQPSAIQTSS
ncbi:zinc finger protein 644a [Brachyhypopomus gauderio]|uniref:zinc finger protein 644a n=1 Tax=Brachyhypopomus gauderio TaxID=698409 RepID=UPI004042FEB6